MKNKISTINLKREYSAPLMDIVQLEPGSLFRAPLSGSKMDVYEEEVNPVVPEDEDKKDVWGVQW